MFTKTEAGEARVATKRRKRGDGVIGEEEEVMEDAYQIDQREKAEFEERLLKKDQEKTKKVDSLVSLFASSHVAPTHYHEFRGS